MAANRVYTVLSCPRCGLEREQEVEVMLDGQGFAKDYRVGERIDWLFYRNAGQGGRPPNGSSTVDGYVVCDTCGKDFFVNVVVECDVLIRVDVNNTRPPIIPDSCAEDS